ncbi:MAG: uracil-DNA glycosylase [Anaerolineae bacterium]|nr:uracil-DNA glycosylase [Anaerolineae bacterium]MCB0198709.1 uracil-DNA glycosylase [Anaerolineae bacterium]MCB0203458.1 uracil-DNA glycosylase [Anaerolineae bacterium]MCB0253361.1 uracil-DNA glycosylase [Anaerolineae bacterium]
MSELDQIAAEVKVCQRCPLARGRTNAVPGEGPANAEIMFIGEGPGFHEDRQGRPFVGASGKLLEDLLGSIGMTRDQVFIANVIKCRPPNNRDPLPAEIEACTPYLDRQEEVLAPRIVVTLGRFSMQRYFPGQSITRIHGQVKRKGDTAYVPMFHPAAALRNPKWMTEMRADFARLPALLEELRSANSAAAPEIAEESAAPPPGDFEQLTLF